METKIITKNKKGLTINSNHKQNNNIEENDNNIKKQKQKTKTKHNKNKNSNNNFNFSFILFFEVFSNDSYFHATPPIFFSRYLYLVGFE
jgi:hypothetical protein